MTKTRGILRTAFAAVLAAIIVCACLLLLCGCFGIAKDPQVAATVNGEPLYEEDVTSFIEGFRKKNSSYENDSSWAEFLRSSGFTPETLRNYVINTQMVPKELIRQECSSRGIQVSDADLDDVIAREKEYYEQRYGDNSWDSVLTSLGYDEASWRQNELDRLLEEQLRNAVIVDARPSDAEIQALANESGSAYSGKSSYYIAFASQEDAQKAHDGLALPTTLEAFSQLGQSTFAGWNSLPAYRDAMSKEYIQASNALNVGDVSEPVEIDGSWLLIFCDASLSIGTDGESVNLRELPADVYEQIYSDAETAKRDRLFDEWLENLSNEASIVIETMPSGLPYNVNVKIPE